MALTSTEPTVNAEAPAPADPPVIERIRPILPPHAFVQSPAPSAASRNGSFVATWTTPNGKWRVRYNGKASMLTMLIFNAQDRPPIDSDIEVSGPNGQWTFPAHTPGPRIMEFLEQVGGIERPPPAPAGFLYVGAVSEDGVRFGPGDPVTFKSDGTATAARDLGQARAESASRAADADAKIRAAQENLASAYRDRATAATEDVDAQAVAELESLRARMTSEADQARNDVATAEERAYWDGLSLDQLRYTARVTSRAAGAVDRLHERSVLANIVNGPSAQRLVTIETAAHIAAQMVEDALDPARAAKDPFDVPTGALA
jgi:hypothetical protein